MYLCVCPKDQAGVEASTPAAIRSLGVGYHPFVGVRAQKNLIFSDSRQTAQRSNEIPFSHAPRRYPEKSFFILNLESVQLCPSAVLPHAISAQNCAEFEVKHKSNSSWTHSNPGTWKLVLILKWKTDWLVANISPTRTQLKSGTVCTVLLGTQFYAFQIQNQKRFLGKAAWGVSFFTAILI